jgi:hypothetical protein
MNLKKMAQWCGAAMFQRAINSASPQKRKAVKCCSDLPILSFQTQASVGIDDGITYIRHYEGRFLEESPQKIVKSGKNKS